MSKPRFVVSRLMGGLGNQLFCYASARALAEEWQAELLVDTISGFARDKYKRMFALDTLSVAVKTANRRQSYLHPFGRCRRGLDRILGNFGTCAYTKEKCNQWHCLLSNPPPRKTVYLDGLWQNPQFFAPIGRKLREQIRPHKLSSESKKIEKEISRHRSASIHIRQYDDAKVFSAQIHCLDLYYYESAIKKLLESADIEHFYCFSDNLAWVGANLTFPRPVTYVDHNLKRGERYAYEDMWLMSRCNHHIIANSTFSWWGAWLDGDPDSAVIAPHAGKWPRPSILPETWITIQSNGSNN